MRPTQLIIPCYNEGKRFDPVKVHALIANAQVGVVLVDDGSSDDTLAILRGLESENLAGVTVLSLPNNVGKGEAVRAGLHHAITSHAQLVGYADADFSTPPQELLRLLATLQHSSHDAVLGSRIARLGAHITRKRTRHYLGRVFATFAAVALGLMVYDTQCGAKWFRVTAALKHALSEPFQTRWAFDVELLGRLIGRLGSEGSTTDVRKLFEEPLLAWEDVGGSKLSIPAMGGTFLDILRLCLAANLAR